MLYNILLKAQIVRYREKEHFYFSGKFTKFKRSNKFGNLDMIRGFIIIIGLTVFLPLKMKGQRFNQINDQLRFNSLTIENGLSNNKVNAICQDQKGFVWFGTNDGLNRYDGYNIYTFKHRWSDSLSLSSSVIYSMLIDNENNLWIGTDHGFNLFDRANEKFKEIKHKNEHIHEIRQVYQGYSGLIYICAQNGLYIYNIKDEDLSMLKFQYDKIPIRNITCILQISKNTFLLGTHKYGLFKYYWDEQMFEKMQDIPNDRINAIYKDRGNNIWVGTQNNHLFKYNILNEKPEQIIIDKSNIRSSRIRSIQQDQERNIWIGTRGGLYKKPRNKEIIYLYGHTDMEIAKLTGNSIFDIFIDEFNVMWLGTFTGGVNFTDLQQKEFINITAKRNDNRYLNDEYVYALVEDISGNLWIGTENGGLNYFNRKTGSFLYFQHDEGNSNTVASNSINAIAIDNLNNVWIGMDQSGGLDYYNIKTKVFTHYKDLYKNKCPLPSDIIWSLLYDSKGNLWIGSSGGLCVKKKNSDCIFCIPELTGRFQIPPHSVEYIYEDNKGIIWIGTEEVGLYYYLNDSIRAFKPDYIKGNIKAIYEDRKGNLWLGGRENGIIYIGKDTIIHITETIDLESNTVFGIQEDNEHNIWATTTMGLVKIIKGVVNPYNPEFRIYTTSDGLLTKQFSRRGSILKSKTGEFFLGTIKGLTYFNPTVIRNNPDKPKVVITNLKILNKDIFPNQEFDERIILTKTISETEKIILSHRDYVFTFEFAALHFANSQQNKYKYILEGFDKEWHETSAKTRFSTYTNIQGGEYRFMVKGTNNDGLWSEDIAAIDIIIVPPFWKTLWFRLLSFGFLIGSIIGFFLLRIYYIKSRKEELEVIVKERTEDLQILNTELEKQKNEVEKTYNNLQILSEFGQQITSVLSLKAINEMILDYVISLMDITNFGIGIYNKNKKSIDFSSFIEDRKIIQPFSSDINDSSSCAAWCFKNQKPIFCNDFINEYKKYIKNLNIRSSQVPKSLIYLPLSAGEKRIGVITVQSYKKNAYTKKDITSLQTLASYLAIALDNANSYEIMVNQTKELNTSNIKLEERQQFIEEQAEELKTQKEKLAKQNKELQELNSTKDRFFSIIAHDLRNPFSTTLGFSQLLSSRYHKLSEEKREKYVHTIFASTQSIYDLLENLLDWSRSQTGGLKYKPTEYRIFDIIKSNLDLLRDVYIRKNIQIKLNVNESFIVFVDYNMINTVIRNLLSNAIKFTQSGGEITISCENKNGFLECSFSDTGVGMSKEVIKNIFKIDRAFSKKGTEGETGTGLGLILCYEFIKRNKGKINVQSQLGEGSNFIITLPNKTK